MISNKDLSELSMSYRGFDFVEALNEIKQWASELDDSLENNIKYDTIEGVVDIILDNCTFC